jgi:hypothetical protein
VAKKFSKGLCPANICDAPVEAVVSMPSADNELLILLILFVLLAASPSLGLDSSYFFIIIMAVIGMGGVEKAFGLRS